ncbi:MULTISPECIES: sporulation histidine kinase inhibitor Sda [Paenibacillus]|uniref:Sporulation inhibitor A n=1 Tax=Paenibacillus naphthalenovorans TaxID=162209 RepID=A0A0U2WAP9_9BACL|nr:MULTISPECIES: sporulation histidine kinase inhibitor Sda [Paenibacillus]ALS23470.1 sporulation inhibitor A [Paenibacillus naphthalenovorans]NTZ17006.1 sporulation histidine kinase inhibitor Sda [Paenibacillus sp. JMULE4]GCL72943.1 sporulation histidine kinase inhibitor Sda [Paenibacillus naphthalenovorans]SDJ28375.1 developmental checkpoint coupling sporulation initiation to replication initiation [Paenibacillus naphthalenovorans]
MKLISDEMLVESYFKAIELQLEDEFVALLLDEIRHRQINLDYYRAGEAQVS